jgi:hypothetical protein
VKWELDTPKYYLLGTYFTLAIDHPPLVWMARGKATNDRVTRWFLQLQRFSFSVVHCQGRCMRTRMPYREGSLPGRAKRAYRGQATEGRHFKAW